MSVRTKILCGCLSLTLVTILVGGLSQRAQTSLGEGALRIYDRAFMSMSYLRSAQTTLMTLSRDLAAGSATPDTVATQLGSALGDLGVAKDRAMSPLGRQYATQLQAVVAQLAAGLDHDKVLPVRGDVEQIERQFDESVEIYAGDGYRTRRAVEALVAETARRTWISMGVAVLAALLITTILSRAIVPSIRHAVRIASAIAAGHLDNRIVATGASETGVLLRALATMQASIAEKIIRIETLMAEQAFSHAAEKASQHARFEAALDNMSQGLCMFDAAGAMLVHNKRFVAMFGEPPATPGAIAGPMAKLCDLPPLTGGQQSRSFTCVLDDGRSIAISQEVMTGGGRVVTYEDVTERQRTEARLSHMARHDALTGLPNRVLFREQIEHGLAQARRGGVLSILCLDLDRFKVVNDTLGHPAGDALLRATAARLLEITREVDMVVRLGGDEFAVIQYAAQRGDDARILAERLVEGLSLPFEIEGQQIVIGTSIGIAMTFDGHETADNLVKSADIALYRAKADGRSTYRFFEIEMDARIQARRRLELDLRVAIQQQQFEVYYQPLVTTRTGNVSGFEALVRWMHPTRGTVSPAEFIPLAEETGLIPVIGLWVLNRACRDAMAWPSNVSVAVNLSPLQFRSPTLVADVAAALEQSGLPATRLELEITESLMLEDSETTLAMLHELRKLGMSISMDDFGTGYSSLSYLRRFPFDKIKIDQSFVRNLDEYGDSIAIIRAVIDLGHSLGMNVLAEGVETDEQLRLLQNAGCQQLQGYLFSQPMPASAVGPLIARYADAPV
jgi:diguanylate cyclase (GGDEF)-like protein